MVHYYRFGTGGGDTLLQIWQGGGGGDQHRVTYPAKACRGKLENVEEGVERAGVWQWWVGSSCSPENMRENSHRKRRGRREGGGEVIGDRK